MTARRPRPTEGAAGLEKGRRRDAVAIATERLRQLIVTGEVPPGSELSQVKLAEMTGTSTTPVREALRQLEVEGLVEARHNRRPRVPTFDPDDLDAVYCTRILLETTAVSITVPTMSEVDLAALAEDLDAMRQAGRLEDIDAWELAHSSFHQRLIDGSGANLRRQIRLMMSRAYRYRRMSVLGERPYGWTTGKPSTNRSSSPVEAASRGRRPHSSRFIWRGPHSPSSPISIPTGRRWRYPRHFARSVSMSGESAHWHLRRLERTMD